MNIITPAQIVAARSAIDTPVVSLCNDMIGATWHQSHVRFIEVASSQQPPDAINLAYAVNLIRSAIPIEQQLSEFVCSPATCAELQRHIQHALLDLEEPDQLENSGLVIALKSVMASTATELYRVDSPSVALASDDSCARRPRAEMFWQREGRFFYLAVHNES